MNKTFVALDGMDRVEVTKLLSEYPEIKLIKVGLELYLQYGNDLIRDLAQNYQVEIFLDLKLHDIPTTVAKAIKGLKGLPIKFLTIHATGGTTMMAQALESAQTYIPECTLLAVTLLTSHSEEEIQSIWGRQKTLALEEILTMINKSGVSGLVCSGADLDIIKTFENRTNVAFTKVTPGIRLTGDSSDDQVRVMTPQDAIDNGASYLVVGRSITRAPENIRKKLFP